MIKGIVRKTDELGRITLPKEYRDTYGVQCGDPLGMLVDGKVISLIRPGEKFVGIVRYIDHLGRYVLPIETRRSLGLAAGQEVDIYIDRQNDAISIRKAGEECAICGANSHLIKVDDSSICLVCLRKANVIAKEYSL